MTKEGIPDDLRRIIEQAGPDMGQVIEDGIARADAEPDLVIEISPASEVILNPTPGPGQNVDRTVAWVAAMHGLPVPDEYISDPKVESGEDAQSMATQAAAEALRLAESQRAETVELPKPGVPMPGDVTDPRRSLVLPEDGSSF